MKNFVDDGMLLRMKITLTIWQYKKKFHCKNRWWLHSNKQGSNTMPLRHRSDFKHCLLCNDYNKKQEKNHMCLLILTSPNNGRHKVHLLHGGIGKVPGGLLKIQKVKKEVSQVLSERKYWVNGATRFLQYLAIIFENDFAEFHLICLQNGRLQMTVVYCNRRCV